MYASHLWLAPNFFPNFREPPGSGAIPPSWLSGKPTRGYSNFYLSISSKLGIDAKMYHKYKYD
jgi:hypothetical protein